jgi:hypothetical protein
MGRTGFLDLARNANDPELVFGSDLVCRGENHGGVGLDIAMAVGDRTRTI